MYNSYRTGIASGFDAYGEPRQPRTEAQIREQLSAAAGDTALAGVEATVVELPVEAVAEVAA